MTTAPAHPPVFAAGDVNLNEEIDSRWGRKPRWFVDTMERSLANAIDDLNAEAAAIRDDAAVLQTQAARLLSEREAFQGWAVKINKLANDLVARVDSYEERQRETEKFNEETFPEDPSEQSQSKKPDPAQELEDAQGDPPDPDEPRSEPREPVAAGLDDDGD